MSTVNLFCVGVRIVWCVCVLSNLRVCVSVVFYLWFGE